MGPTSSSSSSSSSIWFAVGAEVEVVVVITVLVPGRPGAAVEDRGWTSAVFSSHTSSSSSPCAEAAAADFDLDLDLFSSSLLGRDFLSLLLLSSSESSLSSVSSRLFDFFEDLCLEERCFLLEDFDFLWRLLRSSSESVTSSVSPSDSLSRRLERRLRFDDGDRDLTKIRSVHGRRSQDRRANAVPVSCGFRRGGPD